MSRCRLLLAISVASSYTVLRAAPLPASERAAGDHFFPGDTYARRCAYLRAENCFVGVAMAHLRCLVGRRCSGVESMESRG